MSREPWEYAEDYMRNLDEKLSHNPICDNCREYIQDEYALHYDGIWLCENCRKEHMTEIEDEYD